MTNKKAASFIVLNDKGLHTRPSTELVKMAAHYQCDIKLVHNKVEVNAKSLLGILMLAASKGAKINVEAEGEDAEEAVAGILQLARNRFNISY